VLLTNQVHLLLMPDTVRGVAGLMKGLGVPAAIREATDGGSDVGPLDLSP
jgi:hypothetical protein